MKQQIWYNVQFLTQRNFQQVYITDFKLTTRSIWMDGFPSTWRLTQCIENTHIHISHQLTGKHQSITWCWIRQMIHGIDRSPIHVSTNIIRVGVFFNRDLSRNAFFIRWWSYTLNKQIPVNVLFSSGHVGGWWMHKIIQLRDYRRSFHKTVPIFITLIKIIIVWFS